MDDKRQEQYTIKILGALNTLFDSESEHSIDVNDFQKYDTAANDFFYALTTLVPAQVYKKLTGNEVDDALDFNQIVQRLILINAIKNHK